MPVGFCRSVGSAPILSRLENEADHLDHPCASSPYQHPQYSLFCSLADVYSHCGFSCAVLSTILHFVDDLQPVIGLAWDCGAITTGPGLHFSLRLWEYSQTDKVHSVTVPIVLAVGIGVASAKSTILKKDGLDSDQAVGESSDADGESDMGGFGIVTLASLMPVITVQVRFSCLLPVVVTDQHCVTVARYWGSCSSSSLTNRISRNTLLSIVKMPTPCNGTLYASPPPVWCCK